MFKKVDCVPEFAKDLRKLRKRFRTLDDDLQTFIRTQLVLYHKLSKDNKGVFRLSSLKMENPKIYKARKFACRSLKGTGSHSGIRVIYAHFEKDDMIVLIEIYYKGDKKNQDRKRVHHYCRIWQAG